MNKFKYNNKGVTLVELIIVLAIMGIVIQALYSIFFVGNKSFIKGRDKGFAQQDTRTINEIITRELRTARAVGFLEDEMGDDYYSLEFNSSDSSLYKTDKDGNSSPIAVAKGNIKEMFFNRAMDDPGGIIKVSLIVEEKKENFTLGFDILLENVTGFNDEVNDETIIYYTKYE